MQFTVLVFQGHFKKTTIQFIIMDMIHFTLMIAMVWQRKIK